MYQNDGKSLLVMGLLLGAAVGVAAGLLLAPTAGNEMRERLRQGIASGAERIRECRQRNDDDIEAEMDAEIEAESGEPRAD